MIVPSVLAGFYDETKHKANIDVSVTRGVDPGTGFKAERVGPHDYLHVTVKSLNPQRPMLLEVPLMFPGAMGKLHFTVPVTFKDGKDADLKMNAQFSVPIEILVMARNRRSQHFTLDLMVYAPPAFGFRPLAWEWLDSLVQEGRDAKSFAKKAMYWCRAFTTFRRCLLILPRYYEREIKSKENKFKNKPISALQQAVGTERYAIGYLVSAFSFYKPLDRRKSSVAPKTPSGY
jgi:hypothetical protein